MSRALLLSCFLLASCVSVMPPEERADSARRLAADAGWTGEIIATRGFALQTYFARPTQASETLTVYIEGDGLAWISSSMPSFDPTPINALALKLALKDPGPAAYLGRPCQYTKAVQQQGCEQKFWTGHRFAEAVIASSNEAIGKLKEKFGAKRLVLVGYSGGGAVAALVAARRQDVARLVTVAGNLNHRTWARELRLTPLAGSLNPADFAHELTAVPQLHFVGGKDRIIGKFVAESYAGQFKPDSRPRIVVIPEFDHHCCWAERWPELLQEAGNSVSVDHPPAR